MFEYIFKFLLNVLFMLFCKHLIEKNIVKSDVSVCVFLILFYVCFLLMLK